MITYIDLFFPSQGPTAGEVAQLLKEKAGLSFIKGPHDICFQWGSFEEFTESIEKIHSALQGTGVIYRFVSSEEESGSFEDLVGWPPMGVPSHPSTRRER
ncbi:MAG: hypothetical protein KGJ23_03100 [Euryarchaeota archaeon]|nr:hypothetical protein [Euryarchaeota archaeon]MDE1835586.1 hypothetical protein [Euryarchaeota archaeon]MDE1878934.1 hypothetical protein [Euryarchaeota archaeon]MDE2043792.1 hypothetical protein [Thermoplasmata archaeon]